MDLTKFRNVEVSHAGLPLLAASSTSSKSMRREGGGRYEAPKNYVRAGGFPIPVKECTFTFQPGMKRHTPHSMVSGLHSDIGDGTCSDWREVLSLLGYSYENRRFSKRFLSYGDRHPLVSRFFVGSRFMV